MSDEKNDPNFYQFVPEQIVSLEPSEQIKTLKIFERIATIWYEYAKDLEKKYGAEPKTAEDLIKSGEYPKL